MEKNMKIIQLLPTISYGDAISNDALNIRKALLEMKFESEIYAINIDTRLSSVYAIKNIKKLPVLSEKDIIIYHLSTGSSLNQQIRELKCRIIIRYHNITPFSFVKSYNRKLGNLLYEGLQEIKQLSDRADYCIAVSEFNKNDLIKMGYSCKIDVLPILISFEDYKETPSTEIIDKYKNKDLNIVFVGRIAPNKKHEDIIKTFYYIKKNINSKARLFLVGSYNGMEKYYEYLNLYIRKLELQDVYFTGHIKFNEILSYYNIADVFLCMSEHEGFCVPLVESMYFGVPIVAFDSSAVSETLGGAGILLKEKDFILTAELVGHIFNHDDLRNYLIQKEKERVKDFYYNIIKEKLKRYLMNFIEEK